MEWQATVRRVGDLNQDMLNLVVELFRLGGDEFLLYGDEDSLSPAAQAVREKMDAIGRRPNQDGLFDGYGNLRYGAGMCIFPLEWENTLGNGKYLAFAAWHDCMGPIEGHELVVSMLIQCNFYPADSEDQIMEAYLVVLSLVGNQWRPYRTNVDGRAVVIRHNDEPESEWLGNPGEIGIDELLRLSVGYS